MSTRFVTVMPVREENRWCIWPYVDDHNASTLVATCDTFYQDCVHLITAASPFRAHLSVAFFRLQMTSWVDVVFILVKLGKNLPFFAGYLFRHAWWRPQWEDHAWLRLMLERDEAATSASESFTERIGSFSFVVPYNTCQSNAVNRFDVMRPGGQRMNGEANHLWIREWKREGELCKYERRVVLSRRGVGEVESIQLGRTSTRTMIT